MSKKDSTPKEYDLNQAIKDMNESINDYKPLEKACNKVLAIKTDKAVEDKEVKKAGRPKLIDKAMEVKLIKLAEELFFIRSVAGEAGISVETIQRYLTDKDNENFVLSYAYATNRFIAYHQRKMMEYAENKKTADWRAEAHILTLCDKEYSERKYLTEAVANQDAKILMLIKAEQLTIATKKGNEMLKTVINTPSQGEESISLLPFKPEDPKNKGKPKTVKNKGQNGSPPPVE